MMMGSSLGLLTNGNGVFFAPMARDLNILRGSVSLHTTFMSLAKAFTALTVPKVVEKLGLKKTMAMGVILATLGTFLMAFVNNSFSIYLLGIVRGAGANYFSLVPMAMILNRWFAKKNGLATGLASGTSGIIGAISAPILTNVIQGYGWRFAFIGKSVFVLLLVLPVILYPFSLNPEDDGLLPYGYEKQKNQEVLRRPESREVSSTNFIFIALIVFSFLNTLVMFINSHFPGYGESVGLNPETASLMLSGVMLGNLVWKTVFGLLSDKIGGLQTSLTMIALSSVALLMLIFLRHPVPLIIGSFFFGTSISISGVGFPILSNEFFGPVAGANVYSKLNFLSGIGGAFGVGLTGYIFDFTGSYIPAFVMGLVFNFINAGLLIMARRKQKARD